MSEEVRVRTQHQAISSGILDHCAFRPGSPYHYIGRLTSVRECGTAIGELDLRLLDLEDRIGTVASEALATSAHGAGTTRAFTCTLANRAALIC